MLLGIDVGGTFTDAVVMEGATLLAAAKRPTSRDNLLDGVLLAIDDVLAGLDASRISRVSLSTTIVTNALVEGKAEQAALLMLPGPGMNFRGLLPVEPYWLSGYVDHRGREVSRPQRAEIQAACKELNRDLYAVAGKFSVRNPVLERQVADWVQADAAPAHISLSFQVSGSLNLWRRANSAYYNAAVWRHYGKFADAVEAALRQRHIQAPVYILKADGGTLPLNAARNLPVEAVFTGPAASVLGIMALSQPTGEAVSLDIGGTTTDIALWRDGLPLFAQRGAMITGYPTSVQAFRLKSLGIGGDSWVRRQSGNLIIGPERKGSAMAAGGPVPTLSDAMIVAGCLKFGDYGRAAEAMNIVAAEGETAAMAARTVLNQAAGQIVGAIRDMIAEQAAEPVYRVDDIVNQEPLRPEMIIGIGGAAPGLVSLVAGAFGTGCEIPESAAVANAIGAAAAKPTIDITFRADTAQGYFTVAELGLKEKLPARNLSREQAREMAAGYLARRAAQAGIPGGETTIVYEEEFNIVRGFSTTGKIITCRMQLKTGVLTVIKGREGMV